MYIFQPSQGVKILTSFFGGLDVLLLELLGVSLHKREEEN